MDIKLNKQKKETNLLLINSVTFRLWFHSRRCQTEKAEAYYYLNNKTDVIKALPWRYNTEQE